VGSSYTRRVVGRAVGTIVVVASLVLAACTDDDSAAPAPTTTIAVTTTSQVPRGNLDGQLAIGVLMPQSGNGLGQLLGTSMMLAIDMAILEINAAGGVDGKPVIRYTVDEGTDQESAAKGLDELLTKDRVDAIIGPASSKVALALMDKIVDEKVVTCSPTATATALSSYPDDGYFFRTIASDALQGKVLGEVIAETGRRSTAIIASDDEYGRNLSQQLANTLQGEDTTVTSTTSYDATATDFSNVVETALADDPASVAVIGLPDPGGRIIAALEAAGTAPTSIFVTDGMRQSNLADQVEQGRPESVAGIQGVSPAADPMSSWFDEAFHTYAPNAQSLYAAYAYDCTNLIALAAQTAKTDDPTRFVTEMVPTSRNGVSCRNFTDCAPQVAEGRNVDLNGASGRIELLENGDASYGTYDVFVFGPDGKDQTTKSKIDAL
jgi:ABC-type branched-subunit amino acid transport system substrate-binding protein